MNNKICVNTKFFSRTQASGEMSHVKRDLPQDKNVIDPELTKDNFGTTPSSIDKNYSSALKLMPDSVKNSLIDSVLVFPLEQFNKMREEHPQTWQKHIKESMIPMMNEMEQELGFQPLGYQVHLDEGRIDEDTGEVILNPHAHILFANVCTKDITIQKTKKITQKGEDGKALRDPKKPSKYLYELDENGKPKEEIIEIDLKGRAPLSLHQARGKDSVWARQQDIAAKHLKNLGFERGDSKELTNAKHLSKSQHVSRELRRGEQAIESQKLVMAAQKRELKALKADMLLQQAKLGSFIESREEYFADLLSNAPDLSFEGILDSFDEIPDSMKEAALESTEERVESIKGALEVESAKSVDLFASNLAARAAEAKPESSSLTETETNTIKLR